MTDLFDQISAEKYILLTTHRKDGAPKPTAVWAARSGDELLIWTVKDSWKVKRIRNTPKVTLQACDITGRKPFGPTVDAEATILDEVGTKRAKSAIAGKYGALGWIGVRFSDLRSKSRTVGLAVTEPKPDQPA